MGIRYISDQPVAPVTEVEVNQIEELNLYLTRDASRVSIRDEDGETVNIDVDRVDDFITALRVILTKGHYTPA